MLFFDRLILAMRWLTFLVFFTPLSTWAQVTLYTWDRGPEAAAILIPVPKSMTPFDAWMSYLQTITKNPSLVELVPDFRALSPSPKDFQPLEFDPKRHSLFIGNSAEDLKKESRLLNWTKILRERGMKNFVLPAATGSFLSPRDLKSMHKEISDHFSLLLPGGGRDLDPRLFGDEVKGAVNFNGSIDLFEILLIRAYIKYGKGFVYATCRGMQATARALEEGIEQHIPDSFKNALDHVESSHPAKIFQTRNNFAASLFGLSTEVSVYSFHHQAVAYRPGGFLELAAASPDGVPEILEFKDGRGFLIQSHPELTLAGKPFGDLEVAKKIFDWVIPKAQSMYRFSCSRSLSPRL